MGQARQMGTSHWDMPKGTALDGVERRAINRCPNCRDIWSIGILGQCTHLEVECKKCKTKFRVGVPRVGASAEAKPDGDDKLNQAGFVSNKQESRTE